ncbi:MAG: hypothetical protein VXW49_10080, partial [Pseudomonadota bacterium]|nr:hypothetical protein [Pseudomonadota bacterium]
MRIALIHAMPVSIPPIEEAFQRLWPAAETVNLTDDSLAGDLAAAGTLQPEMTDRFQALSRYSVSAGADAILFTCSAFGPCIEAAAADLDQVDGRAGGDAGVPPGDGQHLCVRAVLLQEVLPQLGRVVGVVVL